jgi:hypothetical protein
MDNVTYSLDADTLNAQTGTTNWQEQGEKKLKIMMKKNLQRPNRKQQKT